MYNPAFAGGIDITAVILTAFVLFFIGLIVYLRREDRREGYPLEDDVTGRLEPRAGLLFAAQPKTFHLPHDHGVVTAPRDARDSAVTKARRPGAAPGSPLEPVGDPMLADVGPAAYARRARRPDVLVHGEPKIVPLRIAHGFSLDAKDPEPRGMAVVGADKLTAGSVSDVWIDRGECMIRYLEVELSLPGAAGRRVLTPMPMAVIDKRRRHVRVDAILAAQFANVPALENADQITFDEEERVSAYYGGGYLYATEQRGEPFL